MDFILISVPLTLLALSVIGLAFNGFAKNIAQDVAAEAARFAALADQDSTAAKDRAMRAMGLTLPVSWLPEVQVRRLSSGLACVYEAQVTVKPLAIGFLTGLTQIRESARAVCELQR